MVLIVFRWFFPFLQFFIVSNSVSHFFIRQSYFLSNIKSTHKAKRDLYESLPAGHPEKIALQAELELIEEKGTVKSEK